MEIDKTTIGDVCEFIGGSQPPKSEFSSEPKEGYVRLIQTRDYKTSDFLTYIRRDSTTKFCNKDDIMIGRYGPPIFQICRGLEGAYNVALMKAKPKACIHNKYLYYLLKQRAVFEYVDGLSLRTGGQTGVDLTSLRNYPVLLPPLDYQSQVEKVLGEIDDKIELNNRINVELEGMAKLLYDYWFVQFDFPITAAQAAAMGKPRLDGKPYRASGGKMIYNEVLKREIPKGWEETALSDICNSVRDTIDPAIVDPATLYVGLEHVPRRQFFLDNWELSIVQHALVWGARLPAKDPSVEPVLQLKIWHTSKVNRVSGNDNHAVR